MLLIWTRCLKRRFAVGDNESDGSALSFSVYLGFIMSPFVFVFGCLLWPPFAVFISHTNSSFFSLSFTFHFGEANKVQTLSLYGSTFEMRRWSNKKTVRVSRSRPINLSSPVYSIFLFSARKMPAFPTFYPLMQADVAEGHNAENFLRPTDVLHTSWAVSARDWAAKQASPRAGR